MNIGDLKPASQLAQKLGVKCLVHGPPGSGKTPISKTAPNPIMCVVEPGMLTMRTATNIPAWDAYTPERIEDFFEWLFESNEARAFDTVVIDSLSQLCEIFLTQELKRNKDGRRAYGELSRRVMDLVNKLYYLPEKHTYLITKQATEDENGVSIKKPYFPGKDLNVKIPHLFDEILHAEKAQIPGQPGLTPVFRTKPTFGILARDRSERLNEFEPTNLTTIFNKCMS